MTLSYISFYPPSMVASTRQRPRPPEPVDPTNPTWVARAWQWVFDTLGHLDQCIDGARTETQNLKAEVSALIATRAIENTEFESALAAHESAHKAMDRERKARASLISQQWGIVREVFKVTLDVIKLGIPLLVLKFLGVL